jgi:hypothetical protein
LIIFLFEGKKLSRNILSIRDKEANMKCPRLVTGFTMVFLMLMVIQVFALKPKSGEYRILQPEEAAMAWGGGSGGGGFLGLSPTVGSNPPLVNITLSNVPYVTQYTTDSSGNTEYRSNYYCGLASALMVRAKLVRGHSSAPPIYNNTQQVNYSHVDSDLRTIDANLKNGWYGSGGNKVDVAYLLRGLLYTGSGSDWKDYSITADILRGVYRGRLRGSDYDKDNISNDYGHVTSVSMGPLSAYKDIFATKEISAATKEIWDHINTGGQPVVIVVDSNKQRQGGGINLSSVDPILHYIVIRGIKEDSSGGIRRFSVHDPGDPTYPLEYTEDQLLYLMALTGGTNPPWVYAYGTAVVDPVYRRDPAYILTVEGD